MIEEEKPPRDLWDIKLIPGGLIDLEFIAQVAVLTGAARRAGIDGHRHGDILPRLAPGFADAQTRQELGDAYALYLAMTQMMRLCLDRRVRPRTMFRRAFRTLLLGATDLPDFRVLEAHLKETRRRRSGTHFDRLLAGEAEVGSGGQRGRSSQAALQQRDGRFPNRDAHRNDGADAFRRADLQRAAMQFGQRARNGQPEPRALVVLGELVLHLLERPAELAKRVLGNAAAIVLDASASARPRRCAPAPMMRPPCAGELHRVGQQVDAGSA